MAARYQFSVVHLLFLTTVVAAALGVIRLLDLPDELYRGLLWGYAIFFGLWLAIRGPSVLATLSEISGRRRELQRRRQSLAMEIEAKRAALESKRRDSQDALASLD